MTSFLLHLFICNYGVAGGGGGVSVYTCAIIHAGSDSFLPQAFWKLK